MSTPLDEFAQRLIASVRDPAIRSCDALAKGSVGGVLGERWQLLLRSANAPEAIQELLPDIVDQVLFHLLDAIDNDRLPLALLDGVTFRSLEELGQGEMGGLLAMGEGGWIDKFSTQRHFDSLAGLGEE